MTNRKTKRPTYTAYHVRAALEKRFAPPAFTLLHEVRNQTGYARNERYADCLVASVWPSRGLWIAGIEIKVSRGDWRKELDDPRKADEIQKYCDHWWVAAPRGIVQNGELPTNWGLLELDGRGLHATVDAPQLTPQPLAKPFVCSVMRNANQTVERLVKVARAEMLKELDPENIQSRIGDLEYQLGSKERDLKRLRERLEDANENAAEGARWRAMVTGSSYPWGANQATAEKRLKAAAALNPGNLSELKSQLGRALRAVEEAESVIDDE